MAVAGRIFGPEWRRYSDPATEFEVVRLTDPAFSSGFTAPWQRQCTRHGEFLYWSERTGSRQPFLMNLRSGESRQIAEVAALDPRSLCLSADDRGLIYLDGGVLRYGSLVSSHTRELYNLRPGASLAAVTAGIDGDILLAERLNERTRLVMAGRGGTRVIRELPLEIHVLMARPRRAQVFYRVGERFTLMNFDGSGGRDLRIAAGRTGEAAWVPSGRTLVYLHVPENTKELVTLREYGPEDNSDKLIAKTSQFASVAPNLDASVFVGASRSKASAYVLLLVRAVRRVMLA